MSARYMSNLTLLLAAGFLVVATQAFAPGAIAWITFGVAIGFTCVGAAMLAHRRPAQRVVGCLIAVIGAWTIVASLVFVPTTVLWLGFASALGVVALATAGLTAHELGTERVVHAIEVQEREPVAAA
jgi:hypothetical protein